MRLTFSLTRGIDVKYLIDAAVRGLKQSVPEAADLIVEQAKGLVPVDTGRLRDSIHAEQIDNEPLKQTLGVTPAYEADNEYGFEPAYARRIEYGFIGADSLGRQYHQAAQPYMRPALDTKQAEAVKTIKEGIVSALDDAMSQVAARAARRR